MICDFDALVYLQRRERERILQVCRCVFCIHLCDLLTHYSTGGALYSTMPALVLSLAKAGTEHTGRVENKPPYQLFYVCHPHKRTAPP